MKNLSLGELEERGVVYVPYPPGVSEMILTAVERWKRFCMLDDGSKARLPYDRSRGMGVGYELKRFAGATRDAKEDFHITLSSVEWASDAARAIREPAALEFVNSAKALLAGIEPLVLEFAAGIEKKFSLPGFRDEVAASRNEFFLRFIHYFEGREEDEQLAAPHVDKSGFTLHLYESDPGFEYLDRGKAWQPVVVKSDSTMVISGMRMQYRSQNRLKATYHRVVANKTTSAHGRFSIVCFVHLKDTPEYDKEKAGRLQDFSPGFNYNIPLEDFKQLFK